MSMFNSHSGACRCSLRAAEEIDKAIDDLSVEVAHWHAEFLEQWKSWRQMILNALERGEDGLCMGPDQRARARKTH